MSMNHSDDKVSIEGKDLNILEVGLPASLSASTVDLDPVAEKRLVRKLDLILMPMFTLIFGLNFIDRTAIGNAKIAGFEKDLGLVGYDYNIILTIFYLFFVFAEIPCNLALKHWGSIFLGLMTTLFGVMTIATAFVHNKRELIATRVFLGIAEGGTLPGLTYIMSRYYRRHELVFRVGVFFGCAPPLAGAFGGLLASGFLSLPDFGPVTSWRKIFLIEGVITSGIGILACFFIPTDPEKSRMLSEEERAVAMARIAADQPAKSNGTKERTSWALIKRSFTFNTMLCSFAYFFINISFQGLSLFLPTVVHGLGNFTTIQSQLKTVPPYIVAAVWAVLVSYTGLRLRTRSLAVLLGMPLVVIGYAINLATDNANARYAAAFLSLMGLVPSAPIFVAWGTDNAAPDTVRATTTAIIPGIGAFGAVVAVWTYIPSDAPNYHNGNSLNLATATATCVLAMVGRFYAQWENAKRARGERNYRLEGKTEEEIAQLGYLHPDFRYQI